MASETLAANTTPIIDSGSTLFPAGALTHTTRVLTATANGELNAGKQGIHFLRDSVTAEYTTNGGANWVTWESWEATSGLVSVLEALPPVNLGVSFPMSDIQVRLTSHAEWPDFAFQLQSIQVVGDDAGASPIDPLCRGDFFGF